MTLHRIIPALLAALLLASCGTPAETSKDTDYTPDAADITSAAPETDAPEEELIIEYVCTPGIPHIHPEAEEIHVVYDHYIETVGSEKAVSGDGLAALTEWFDGLEYYYVEPEEVMPTEGGGTFIFSYPDIDCNGFMYTDSGYLIFDSQYYKVENPRAPLSMFPETFDEIKAAASELGEYEKGVLVSYSELHNGNYQETYMGDVITEWLTGLEVETCESKDLTSENSVYVHLTWFNYNYINLYYVEMAGEFYIMDSKALWYHILNPSELPTDEEAPYKNPWDSEDGISEGF